MKDGCLTICLLIGLLVSPMLPGQDCATYTDWGARLEAEFAEVDFGRLVNNSRQSNRYLDLLFADENFRPSVGQSFAALNERNRQKAARLWVRCGGKQHQLRPGTVSWLSYFAVLPFTQVAAAERVMSRTVQLTTLRNSVAEEMAKLQDTETMTLLDFLAIERSISTKYGALWPSEITSLREAVTTAISEAADRELTEAVQIARQQAPSLRQLNYLLAFDDYHNQTLSWAAPDAAQDAKNAINQEIGATVVALLPKYAERLEAINTEDLLSLTPLTKLKKEAIADFAGVANHRGVVDLLRRISEKQTAITVANVGELRSMISEVEQDKNLDGFDQLLAQLDQNEATIRQLRESIQQRRSAIATMKAVEAEKRRQVANAQAQKDAQAAKEWEEYAFRTNQRIDLLRTQLESKYGGSLPTFEQLYYLQWYASRIRKKTEPSDEQSFRQYASKIGLRLTNRDGALYSDFNRFTNATGLTAHTSRVSSSSSNSAYLSAALIWSVPSVTLRE